MPSELYVGKGTSGATYIFDESTNSGKVATVHDPQYAQLFAAAPKLLEACEDALNTSESDMQYILDNGRLRNILQVAINKAKQL